MAGNKLKTYEYYFSLIDLLISDINNVTIRDIADIIEELHQELDKIEN